MPRESKNWTQKARDRLSASKALDYIIDVAHGEIEVDQGRYRACEFIANKLIANPPQATVELDKRDVPDFHYVRPED